MSYPLRMLDEASDEVYEASLWYEKHRVGLGAEFLDEIYRAFDAISASPMTLPPIERGSRERIVKRFPYVVRYRFDGQSVVVLAVTHARRDASAWEDRLDQR